MYRKSSAERLKMSSVRNSSNRSVRNTRLFSTSSSSAAGLVLLTIGSLLLLIAFASTHVSVVEFDVNQDKQHATNHPSLHYSPQHDVMHVQRQYSQQPNHDLRSSFRASPSSLPSSSLLEFVHITKTGGTAIERAAAKAGIPWGICHFESLRRDICFLVRPDLAWPRTFPLKQHDLLPFHLSKNDSSNSQLEYWHTPPHWFRNNPFVGRNTFTVVRNPYDRYISEFYCPHYGYYSNVIRPKRIHDTTIDRLAQFEQLKQQQDAIHASRRRNDITERNKDDKNHYLNHRALSETLIVPTNKTDTDNDKDDNDTRILLNEWLLERLRTYGRSDTITTGHLLPQHYYVYDSNNNGTTPVITHVLRYENLQNDFDTLMQQYKLNVSLVVAGTAITEGGRIINGGYSYQNTRHNNNKKRRRMTQADLFPETIQAINDFCLNDFHMFDYEMMDPKVINNNYY